jgi:DNA-binding MarR family transcriptional regulator
MALRNSYGIPYKSRAVKTTNTRADADIQSVLDSLRRVVHAMRVSGRALASSSKLSAAQLFVLRSLADVDALSMNDLAARTMTHQSSVSVVVARLVEAKLVARRRAADDGRRVEVALTKRGRAALAGAPDPAQERWIATLRALPTSDRKALAKGLERWVAALGLDEAPAVMFFEDAPRARKAKGASHA